MSDPQSPRWYTDCDKVKSEWDSDPDKSEVEMCAAITKKSGEAHCCSTTCCSNKTMCTLQEVYDAVLMHHCTASGSSSGGSSSTGAGSAGSHNNLNYRGPGMTCTQVESAYEDGILAFGKNSESTMYGVH
jgi:hypothetical protein